MNQLVAIHDAAALPHGSARRTLGALRTAIHGGGWHRLMRSAEEDWWEAVIEALGSGEEHIVLAIRFSDLTVWVGWALRPPRDLAFESMAIPLDEPDPHARPPELEGWPAFEIPALP